MTANKKPTERPIYRAVMIGLAVGSAVFLAGRWVGQLDVETSLIVAGFFGFAVATYLIQTINSGKS